MYHHELLDCPLFPMVLFYIVIRGLLAINQAWDKSVKRAADKQLKDQAKVGADPEILDGYYVVPTPSTSQALAKRQQPSINPQPTLPPNQQRRLP